MADIEALEAALQREVDRETLAVYADALQSSGDPRGELIAIDLHIDAHGETPELAERRRDRLFAWLGGESIAGRRWNPRRFKYGLYDGFAEAFDDLNNSKYLDALFASPAGPYLRGVTILSNFKKGEMFDGFVERPHPWLRRLAMTHISDQLTNEKIAAIVRATPRLEEVALEGGHKNFGAFDHPTVRRLAVTWDSLHFGSRNLQQLVELDYRNGDYPFLDVARDLPALRRIDVSRSSPDIAHERFERLPERIERLRVPAPRDDYARRRILALADGRPHTTIEVAHGYELHAAVHATLEHPRVRMCPAYPWPPRDSLSHERYESRDLTLGARHVSLKDFILAMEAQYDRLDDDARAAWREFWTCYAALGSGIQQMPRARLLRAIDALDDCTFRGLVGSWGELAAELRAWNPAASTVSIAIRKL